MKTPRQLAPINPLPEPPPSNPAERARWLARYRRSGQTQRDFAKAQGLKLSRLRYWLYGATSVVPSSVPAPRLQEIEFRGWAGATHWSAEISLPAGRTIRLDAQLARDLITPLLSQS